MDGRFGEAQDATEAAQADALLAQVVDLRDKALDVLDTAQGSEVRGRHGGTVAPHR